MSEDRINKIKERKKRKGVFSRIYSFIVFLIFLSVIFVITVVAAAIFWVSSPRQTLVELAPGVSAKLASKQFYNAGVIKSPTLLSMYLTFMGYSKKIHTGRYDIPAGTTMSDLAKMLVKGDVLNYRFTIVEGWAIKDISKALVGQQFLGNELVPEKYADLCFNKNFIASLGLDNVSSLEGYLFPDSYEFAILYDPKTLIKMQLSRFSEVFGSDERDRAREMGYTANQILTIASLIEKETSKPDERPLVAAVIYNRLKKNMLLQIDPTIIYGINNFDGNIRKKDLSNPHPYNTYVHRGLPPGPICNPGEGSIKAALNPANVRYLYFVSKNDGSHVFSNTLKEHLRAVMRYQLKRGKK